jgi:hypothetical protein
VVVTIPAVPLPKDSVRPTIDFTIKGGWSFDSRRRIFKSERGETFSPLGHLPKSSRIAYKVPRVARADARKLDEHERALRRYMHLVLPAGEQPARFLRRVRAWPPVEEAHVTPQVSLPGAL